MKILAIESSAMTASVAIADEDRIIAEYTTNFKKTHSQTLMPMIDEIIKRTETDPGELDAIAVTKGPGSFTGLRIGAATAKGLGLALGKPLIPVPTLAALAYNFAGAKDLVVPIMDARRDQVYAGVYTFDEDYEMNFCAGCESVPKEDMDAETGLNKYSFRMVNVIPDAAVAISELMEKLNAIGENVIFLGDGVPVFGDIIRETADFPFAFAPVNLNDQKASSVCALAFVLAEEGMLVDAKDFAPDYFRKSQAERCREEGNKN